MALKVEKQIYIDYAICDPKECEFECLDVCPVTKRDIQNPAICNKEGKPVIVEEICTECRRCQRSCPLGAIFFNGKPLLSKVKKIKNGKLVDLKIWKSKPYVLDEMKFNRFNRQNTIFSRVSNDPQFPSFKKGIYSSHEMIIEQNKSGYSIIEAALSTASWTVHDKFAGAFSWGKIQTTPDIKFDEVEVDIKKFEIDNPKEMSKVIKQVGKGFGAALVGITKLNRDWIYTHDRSGEIVNIPDTIQNVIVIAIEMDLEALQTSPAFTAAFATGNGYSRMAFVQSCMAEFIRNLGYAAIPAGNGVGLSVPLAIDAGLGQYGRHGLLITEEYGSNVRLCKVFTDMPLDSDEPIDLGVLDFCRTCKRCAESCPSNSISTEVNPTWEGPTKSNNPGIYKWYVNVETCYQFWTKNGNDCSNCIVACPFTKNKHWSHKIARFFIKKFPRFNKLWVKLDHLFGYGKQRDPQEFWNDDKKFIHTRSNSKT
ncbi:MAG: 3-chloro-4-hydroxyphenylacetate reductive dehalogenase precursor [Candidatus Heimdallarchaeota archaeon LC_2]|nr:MAG: 3-chloro-4-hydroxyphenylacetate reductive dehalogenase precursor [Candidatus Heimdallarchaeota archaeon LC_2]